MMNEMCDYFLNKKKFQQSKKKKIKKIAYLDAFLDAS
jgi:hypothetical protein